MTRLGKAQMALKDHERICVERFLEAIGKASTLIEDSEAPDFKVRFGEEVVGIRIADGWRPPSSR